MLRKTVQDSDESLMLAFQNGDVSAFEMLYGRHKNSLVNYLYKASCNRQLSEDIAQSTWEKLIDLAGNDEYQTHNTSTFKTLLFTIAKRRFIDHTRSAAEKKRTADFDFEKLYDITSGSQNSSPEETEHQRQTWVLYMKALQELPGEQRDVLLLRLQADMSWEEIASVTGATWETVRSRARYGFKKLREM